MLNFQQNIVVPEIFVIFNKGNPHISNGMFLEPKKCVCLVGFYLTISNQSLKISNQLSIISRYQLNLLPCTRA